MNYKLRQATDADYDFLYALHCNTIRSAVEATWGWDDKFQSSRFRENFVARENQLIIVDDRPVGVLKVDASDEHCFIGLIEILPDYQGKGLGSRVIGDILEDAFARGQAVSLHVLKTNPAARRLYERLGFRIEEARHERYIMTIDASEIGRK